MLLSWEACRITGKLQIFCWSFTHSFILALKFDPFVSLVPLGLYDFAVSSEELQLPFCLLLSLLKMDTCSI